MSLDEILAEAKKLSPADRNRLALRLLDEQEIEEAYERLLAYRSGNVETIPYPFGHTE